MPRKNALPLLPALLTAAAIFAASAGAAAPAYTAFDAPGTVTEPSAIDDSNMITGSYHAASGIQRGFLRRADGSIVSFSPQRHAAADPLAINGKGDVAGTFVGDSHRSLGFVRERGGKMEQINLAGDEGDTNINSISATGYIGGWVYDPSGLAGFAQAPGGTITMYYQADETWVRAVNRSGTVAGEWTDYTNDHGFVGVPNGGTFGTMTSFDPTGSVKTFATGIDDAGRVTGYYSDASGRYHGYVRTAGGKITSFDPKGSAATYALSINRDGTVAGYFLDGDDTAHGFVREPGGKITSFDVPCSSSTNATGVNDTGAVTGYYSDSAGIHGFLRTP